MLPHSLLAGHVSVAAPFAVVHARFVPRAADDALAAIDRARTRLLPHAALLDALLTSVDVGRTPCIYVFAVTAADDAPRAAQSLGQLQLDGLAGGEPGWFSFDDVCPTPGAALRTVCSHFLEAVRVRLIDDIARAAADSRPLRRVTRVGGGFLLGAPSCSSNEWSSSWEHRVQSRPLLLCQLQVHLRRTALAIHPLLLPTPFLPLSHCLPVPPGTPVTLLPHATPAFFLARYSGPSSALTAQFEQSLQGRGVGAWSSSKPDYVIAWISVENKQGEDKGIVLVYPTALCLAFSAPPRAPLDPIPSLPAALQPSPQPPPSSAAPCPPGRPTSDSVRAFRALALSRSKDIRHVAAEVAAYVDAVARDREKERERLKRERETNASSLVRPTIQPPGPSLPPPPVFYPSPPQADTTGPTSQSTFDPSWPMQPQPYLAMDMDFDIAMDMVMSPFDVSTSRGGPSHTADTASGSGLDFDDTAFTDDDFSFFDRPSAPTAMTTSTAAISPLFTTDIPSATPHVSTSAATHTPTPALPDLLPPSPGPTPPSHSAPATPTATVHLDPFIGSNSTFDPIPFADYHRLLDGKYAVGKFSAPDVCADKVGWRKDYMAATDPRIAVVRKLKRKLPFDQGGKVVKSPTSTTFPSWVDDWSSSASTSTSSHDADIDSDSTASTRSPSPSPSPPHSRPTTPPPTYLPLGPTLLSTHFTHSSLLPLSTPLRRPSSPLPSSHPHIHPAASALTPVSPAATLGQSKSLEAAAAMIATEVVENPPWAEAWRASTLVAGRVPGEVWLADVCAISQLLGTVPGVEGSMTLESLFCESEKETTEKAKKGNVNMLEAPMIAIGKGDAVIQVLPTALRFWEKLGLGPKGGAKNGTVFVLFEDEGEQRMQQVQAWLETVASNYEGRHLGTLIPGKNPACPRDGLLPLRFDSSFRKTLASLIASLASQSSIFFIVIPMLTLTFASPTLRQIFTAVTKASKTYSEVHFQFVPEQLLHDSFTNPAFDYSISDICLSVYDRILTPVDRLMSRSFEHGVRVRKYFQQPALTLARPIYSKATFVRAAHASLDVMDRDTFLHVGYQLSQCGKWILAACVDQRGEAHDLGVWLMQTPGEGDPEDVSVEVSIVRKVWDFAIRFAKKANVEWRVVFSKLGAIGENELDAWTSWIDSNSRGLHILSFTLLSVEPNTPWTFISTRTPAPKLPKAHNLSRVSSNAKVQPQIFTDITWTIFATSPYNHLSQSYPPSFADLGILLSHVPEDVGQSAGYEQSSLPHPLPLLPRSSTTLICVPATPSPTSISMLHLHLLHSIRRPGFASSAQDISSLHTAITQNFHELAVLARARWRLNVNPILPFHLAAVEAMRIALGRDQYGIDIADSA